jgi:hypothetical protein
LWFATRGGVVELQFDLARGELRELVRHRIGPATLVGRHGLGAGATLLVDRGRAARGHAALILRLRGDDDGGLCIAEGPRTRSSRSAAASTPSSSWPTGPPPDPGRLTSPSRMASPAGALLPGRRPPRRRGRRASLAPAHPVLAAPARPA